MKDKSNSGFGNRAQDLAKQRSKRREEKVTSVALMEAVEVTERMYRTRHRGRGDKGLRVLEQLSSDTGVSERYLYRLLYQWKGMKDVAGEAYRLLKVADERYRAMCNANEAAAARMKAERLELRYSHEADQKPAPQVLGMYSFDD